GPMIACVSPLRMVRFTPLRMGVVPASVSTVTCRSRISRTAMSVFLLHVDVNEHVVAVDLNGVDRNGLVSREVQGLAGDERECGSVCPAFERVTLDEALRKRDLTVRAGVANGVHVTVGVENNGDSHAIDLDAARLVLNQFAQAAHALGTPAATPVAISRSISARSASCSSGT